MPSDHFKLSLYKSEKIVLTTGDQSFNEALFYKKRIFYDLPTHKTGAYLYFIYLIFLINQINIPIKYIVIYYMNI